MKKTLLALAVILVVSIALSLPLFAPGFYTIHDDQQFARLQVFDQALKGGQFPVRWVGGLGFGFGYPLFIFYPPLVYIVGEAFHLMGSGTVESIKLVVFLSIFASGVAMYVFVKDLWGRLPALVAALFYMLVPYRALDIYVRGALAESFSFVWLPLILWSFFKLNQTGKSVYIILSAIFLSLLMLTHNLILLPFMLLLPIYLVFLIMASPNKKQSAVYSLLSTVLALGLSAFFWIPALLEKKFTIVDQLLLVNLANYNMHFVYPQQLWNWTWGFGGSTLGTADGISFKIGKLHILVSIAAFIIAVFTLVKSKASSKLSTVNCQLSTVLFCLFLASAFMTTFYSKFIWDMIPPLGYLQFPWRFLTFTALFSSILAGYLIYSLKVPVFKLAAAVGLLILLAVPNIKLFRPQAYRSDLTAEMVTSKEYISWYVSYSSFEYLPKGVELVRNNLGANVASIQKEQIPQSRIEIINGASQISETINKPHLLVFNADSDKQTTVRVNSFNFPGWTATVDNQRVEIDDNNPLSLITLNIPGGKHEIKVAFENTPIRTFANMISLISIIGTLFLLTKKWQKTTD
ncbi:MAG: hypothetical protein Q8P25_04310 [Candidatus Curtissbacteria bacterium]|nr:hypothetical protein [Candidatus Curtissbacteria bacterium]